MRPFRSSFLAEDLGLISEEVRNLRDLAGLPGMAVLQFAFDGDAKIYIFLITWLKTWFCT